MMRGVDKSRELWKLLVNEGLDYECCSGTNTRLPFTAMSKKYGKAWIEYLEAAWFARDEMDDTEFCRINGGIPATFLEKKLRGN